MISRPAMFHRFGLTLLTAVALAACSPSPSPEAAQPTPAAPAASAPATTSAASAAPASPEAPARKPGPVVPPSGEAPVAGTDYVVIPGGSPFQRSSGKIEVVEVFGYTCPHCATFEPLVSAWAAKLPADVDFVPMAAPFGGYWMPYAKAFYTAQAMGVAERSHEAMFRAIHIDRSLPVQPLPTAEQLGQFYAQFGVDPAQFASTMSSFAINAKVNQANEFIERSFVGDVASTPTLIVNGKYRIKGQSFEEALRVADHLIAMERAAAATPAATTTAGAGE